MRLSNCSWSCDVYFFRTAQAGRYFRAKDAEALTRIFQQIDRLERTPVDVVRYTRHEERTRPFLAAALVLLAGELLLSATIVVRVP